MGPDWKEEEKPGGIAKSFRSEMQFSLVIYRTQLFNPADMDNVKKVQSGYKIKTLSGFLGQSAPPAAPTLNWPKTEPPSVYLFGKGSWQPPALVPVRNLNALDVKRFGDKSLENFIRTDMRYGHDGLFQGPRGWNYLEYPRPIQNPNLWLDMQST